MITLPPLDKVTLVRLSREGGLAYFPERARPRDIDLAACPEPLRHEVCQALEHAAPLARAPGQGGGADQRVFRIDVIFQDGAATAISFEVPEAQTPDTLLRLWKER